MDQTFNPPHFHMVLDLPADAGPTETARRNRLTILHAFEALVAGDQQAIAKLLDPQVVFREASGLPYGCEATGAEAAAAGVAGMFEAWSSVEVHILDVLAAGDMVIAYMTFAAIARATGRQYQGPTAEYFRLRDDRIIEWWPIYWDTHAVRVACGQA